MARRKRTIELTFDRRVFSVRDANRFPDRVGLDEGDRVEIRLVGTVKDFSSQLARDGKRELNAHVEALEGRIVRVIDHERPKKRTVRRIRST